MAEEAPGARRPPPLPLRRRGSLTVHPAPRPGSWHFRVPQLLPGSSAVSGASPHLAASSREAAAARPAHAHKEDGRSAVRGGARALRKGGHVTAGLGWHVLGAKAPAAAAGAGLLGPSAPPWGRASVSPSALGGAHVSRCCSVPRSSGDGCGPGGSTVPCLLAAPGELSVSGLPSPAIIVIIIIVFTIFGQSPNSPTCVSSPGRGRLPPVQPAAAMPLSCHPGLSRTHLIMRRSLWHSLSSLPPCCC